MNHDEFERLADSAFEGRDDALALERIEALAAGDPELRARWVDLQAARTGLAGAGLELLPAGFHDALIGTARVEGSRHTRGSWLSFITAAIQTRPIFALGGAVAAGLAIGVIGIGLIMGGLRAGRDLAPATTASLPASSEAVTTTALERGGARVTVTARRVSGATLVRLDAREGTPATVTLSWDPAALRLTAVRWESPDAPSFDPAPGRLVLRIPVAAGSELSFQDIVSGGSAVRVTLSAAGGAEEGTLRMPR